MGLFEHLDPALMALWYVAFLLSTTVHEAAHAVAALRGGDRTAYEAGQASLNPLPHMAREPFGMVVMPILSFLFAGWMIGWASAPYDPHWAERHPRRAGLMALAGPLANLALSALAIAAIYGLVVSGWGTFPQVPSLSQLFQPADPASPLAPLASFLSILAVLNALLGGFNLIPVPPLDGASVVAGLGGEGAARVMGSIQRMPMAGFLGLLVAWRLFDFLAGPIIRAVLHLALPGV